MEEESYFIASLLISYHALERLLRFQGSRRIRIKTKQGNDI